VRASSEAWNEWIIQGTEKSAIIKYLFSPITGKPGSFRCVKSFPLRHISIRVPWHDAAWNGSVCACPGRNTSCLKLKNIFETKDEEIEAEVAGKFIHEIESDQFPPCVKERATFMADFSFTRTHEHPYTKRSKETHTHFRPTALHYPAYGAAALPFRWMMKKFVFGDPEKKEAGLIDRFPLQEVSLAIEPSKELLKFDTNWLQDHRNHRTLLDCFWNHVRPVESLVFFYAKQVPLVEDTGRRVIVGVGRVKSIGNLTEYEYEGAPGNKLRSLLWERMVIHSIRPDLADGFLMPYHEALVKSDDGRAFDPAEIVAFAPEDRFEEFSYATEHVGHDAAISALLACRAALLRASELFNISISKQEQWIDRELGRLWKKRGPFPGLGAVLSATGITMGNFIAQALTDTVGDEGNPWPAWDATLQNPDKHLPKELSRHIDGTIAKAWKRMDQERRAFLELLSRIDLTIEQAGFLAIPEVRAEGGVTLSDSDFIKNPYLIYEATRLTTTPVAIGTVDRGLFPAIFVRDRFPIPAPTLVKTAVDARRLRALTIRELEDATARGDTLRAREDIITALRRREESQNETRTEVTADLLAVAEEEQFDDEIRIIRMADKRLAYQLDRFHAVGNIIRDMVKKRSQPPRHQLAVDWRAELDTRLGSLPTEAEERDKEERARQEKAAALAEISASRFSVLIGPAGTGKTTLLSVLCQRAEVNGEGILLLAPTGKARVRMEAIAKQAGIENYEAYTLAQFLSTTDRYVGSTRRYRLTGEPGDKGARTVIVDECSMLTEEMMAALLEALSGVHRLIFVGDSRQLPPIGAGRPFADIIAYLTPTDIEARFPRVGAAFAELTVPRRQGSGERDDLQLAAWFGGAVTAPGDDQVFEILAGRRVSDHIRFFQWETPDELEAALPKVIAETLSFAADKEEWQSFAESLGAQLDDNGSAWFNVAYGSRASSGKQAEAWQILSPVRQKPWGVDPLNRLVHVRYKGQQIEKARNPGRFRSIPTPMGDAQIIYGDKVINNSNWSVWKKRIYPEPEKNGYLANGEIGMVVGHRKTKARDWWPKDLEIEFSTQVGKSFKFWKSDFDPEGDANLDLAYALTVHRAQGSEFEVVFLVLPRSPLMLTRELLYTALTRQKKKVVVLHQGSATDLQKLSSEKYSATASRLTNLFSAPKPVKVGDSFLEERLIHVTSRGEAVRSKSEVIIANLLHSRKIAYHYEHPLEINGVTKYPDFTIEDDDTGITYYWEHCGMLNDPAYTRRWIEKQRWYRSIGILPLSEGGGTKGTLIVSEDQSDGGIDCSKIDLFINHIKSS
jgi:ATP-dependent exoDNAse (exonuclease V) alpha subunit